MYSSDIILGQPNPMFFDFRLYTDGIKSMVASNMLMGVLK